MPVINCCRLIKYKSKSQSPSLQARQNRHKSGFILCRFCIILYLRYLFLIHYSYETGLVFLPAFYTQGKFKPAKGVSDVACKRSFAVEPNPVPNEKGKPAREPNVIEGGRGLWHGVFCLFVDVGYFSFKSLLPFNASNGNPHV